MFEGPVQQLIDELGKLPTIGPKTAQRLAFHLIQEDPEAVQRLEKALSAVRSGVEYCPECGNLSSGGLCHICSDPRRDLTQICVVEETKDIPPMEAMQEFRGRYHVLGGSLNPSRGISPDVLRIRQLVSRVGRAAVGPDGTETDTHVEEVILATNPTTEGEATAAFVARLLKDFPGLTVSRLATGLSMGADLEFADQVTLGRAFIGRRRLSG